ncbi:hypothetical protein TNCV_3744841 [Trichonephila clavipes]|nr:hypothetical protein TNCV_3744841 [Trichonephila clavipes]
MVESYKLSPVLHVQDSPVLFLVISKRVMHRAWLPVECPDEPWMNFLVKEVSLRIPPLITRCDKSIQTNSPIFISNPLEDAHIILLVLYHHPLPLDGFNLSCQPCVLFSFIAHQNHFLLRAGDNQTPLPASL